MLLSKLAEVNTVSHTTRIEEKGVDEGQHVTVVHFTALWKGHQVPP